MSVGFGRLKDRGLTEGVVAGFGSGETAAVGVKGGYLAAGFVDL